MTRVPPILGPIVRQWIALLARWSMPRLSGSVRLRGLNSAVEVARDRFGVPRIRGACAHDVIFAQGFVHAQDRLWQMEFQRALSSGRLSEIVGPEALEADRWVRTIGIRRAAEEDEKALPAEARTEILAYIEGVNAFLSAGKLPVELRILGHMPSPWTAVDVLLWPKMVSWNLSMNWESELLRAQLVRELGPERAAELEPPWPGFWPVIVPKAYGRGGRRGPGPGRIGGGSAGGRGDRAIRGSVGGISFGGSRALRHFFGSSPWEGMGSNSWAISGARTATGLPILANDMHLPLHAPSYWYENRLECPEFRVSGVTFPGTPTIVAGHNGRVAWGFTNSCVDVQDLYEERLRESAGKKIQYLFRGGWRDAVVLRERIGVRGRGAEEVEIVVTRHGPVINRDPSRLPRDAPLALKWASAEGDSTSYAGFLMMRARTCGEFREALRHWTSPCQNIVYADVEGNIAYTLGGRIPVRAKGGGAMPVPGWTGAHEWKGFIPFEELPHLWNPPEGFIATANNKVAHDGYRYELGRDYCMGDRAERIVELIGRRPVVDLEYAMRMQSDQVSTTARRVGRYLAGFEGKSPYAALARAVMDGFDGELSADSSAAALYEVFMRVLVRRTFEGELGGLTARYIGKGPEAPLAMHGIFGFRAWERVLAMLLEDGGGKREIPRGGGLREGEGAEGRALRDEGGDGVFRLVEESLGEAFEFLEKRLGRNRKKWSWGRMHTLSFTHLLGRVKPLRKFFDRGTYRTGGDGNTIWAQFCSMHDMDMRAQIGPPFRFVADLSDLGGSMGVLVPGQSGVPSSPHYDDQIRDWLSGRYHRMAFRGEDVEGKGARILELLPE